ncbi:MAG: hypothetical protein M1827_001341 [Pycnora praestabilis]|nr:MAG: hypothetical protein M1827_001341 [Pycnora praestabilis]
MAALFLHAPSSPFTKSSIDRQYPWPGSPSPNDSSTSLGTVHRRGNHRLSTGSFVSALSAQGRSPILTNENDPPWHASQYLLSRAHSNHSLLDSGRTSEHILRKSSWGTDILPPPRPDKRALQLESDELETVDLGSENKTLWTSNIKDSIKSSIFNSPPNVFHKEISMDVNDYPGSRIHDTRPLESYKTSEIHPRPFKRWISTLRRKSNNRTTSLTTRITQGSLDGTDDLGNDMDQQVLRTNINQHKKSSSLSSIAFVTAVKTASASLASFSTTPRTRFAHRSSRLRESARSSRFSHVGGRMSMDSNTLSINPAMDEGVRDRSIKRRNVLEELIGTEEDYIADLKVLVNVYFTLLASVPMLSQHTRSLIHRNVTDILQLHEELLSELHRIVPDTDRPQGCIKLPLVERPGHVRWHSIDIISPAKDSKDMRKDRHSFDQSDKMVEGLVADPKTAAIVARVFDKFTRRFFSYEEYSAMYDMMVQDVASTYKNIPTWHAYEKGIEALSASLAPLKTRDMHLRKGLTFGDLLIKPIQRVCKYPLLFADLYKYTPVYDCPDSHAEIEKVLYRLREMTHEVNKATKDRKTRDRIEKTWLLQDRLVLQDQSTRAVELRLLGHALLCGVLHVTYQTRNSIRGDYMICVLFKSCLLFASVTDNGSLYAVIATISLGDLRIEPTDNGKGLQCHNALYSWKVIFESDHRLFEVILSACSEIEEQEWRTRLLERSAAEGKKLSERDFLSQDLCSSLTLDLKPLGNIFGLPGTLTRRLSVQRAATVGPKSKICQVIVRNTHALKDGVEPQFPMLAALNRSQSLLSNHRIPVLAPSRMDRIHLESALADVWTRDALPYPGMGGKRGDHLIKASASSLMRKLSMASITNSFSKRSTSHTAVTSSISRTELRPADDNKKHSQGPSVNVTGDRNRPSKSQRGPHLFPKVPPPRNISVSSSQSSETNGSNLQYPKKCDTPMPLKTNLAENNNVRADNSKRTGRKVGPSRLAMSLSSERIRKFFS